MTKKELIEAFCNGSQFKFIDHFPAPLYHPDLQGQKVIIKDLMWEQEDVVSVQTINGEYSGIFYLWSIEKCPETKHWREVNDRRNLEELVQWLEYGKKSGYKAARQSEKQEYYWAELLRNLLEKQNDK